MSNLVLSNLTINGRPVGLFEPDPPFPYQTIQIGNQIWMAESLHEDDGGEGILVKNNITINGVLYPKICYYTYEAAVRIADTVNGWHLPTKSEVDTLVQYVNNGTYNSALSNMMKSTTGWNNNGIDSYGWNAKPDGKDDPYIGFNPGGEYTLWQQGAYRWYVTEDNRSANGTERHDYGFSVRLIKDT